MAAISAALFAIAVLLYFILLALVRAADAVTRLSNALASPSKRTLNSGTGEESS